MDILIPLSGYEESWDALDQAILIAQHENAKLHGLHIVDSLDDVEKSNAQGVKAHFEQTCKDAGIEGNLVIDVGDITRKICDRAVLTDLVIVKIVHPPMGGLSSLSSPFRTIIENSSRPLITVPAKARDFKRALLAYDGSDRSKEALFVATYLAEIWKTELIVFTALDGTRLKPDVQDYVRRYLDIHEVEADYIVTDQDSKAYLKSTVDERQADLVLMGGYGRSVIREMVIGSTLDYMLRESTVPTFICR